MFLLELHASRITASLAARAVTAREEADRPDGAWCRQLETRPAVRLYVDSVRVEAVEPGVCQTVEDLAVAVGLSTIPIA